jgi:exopolysaccharide biosynthesis polyprenyl glycosylphosphotransferase
LLTPGATYVILVHMGRPAPARSHAASVGTAAEPLLARLNARGFRLLMLLDALVLAAALVVPMVVRHGLAWPSYSLWDYTVGYTLIVCLHVLSLYFSGLYERSHRLGTRSVVPRVVAGTTGAILLVALAELLSGVYLVPRANLPVVVVLASLGVTANRGLSRRLERRRIGPARVLLVGAPEDVDLARTHLADADQPATVVGAAGTADGLVELVGRTDATDVLLLSGTALDDIYPEPLMALEGAGVAVLQRITARDTLLGLQSVREVAGMPCVTLHTHTLPRSRARAKRTMEMFLLVVTLPVTLPLIALVGLYVRVVAGAPVIYRQQRVGRDGRPFAILKFRTMVRDAEQQGEVVIATRDDPRVIPACRWLRAMRFDELPQLWNVVRGEMSLVGPRPERPEMTEHFEKLIPGYARRHEIPPGLTGLAQVQGRYHTDPAYKLGHDLQYLVNWSPVLDLVILARTVWVVLARKV